MGSSEYSYATIVKMLPKPYAAPFHVASGEHEARGHLSTYVFCYSVQDKHDVSCFVIDAKGRKRRLHLGNLADSGSIIAQFLDGIDSAFGDRRFTKEEIKGRLSPKLTGNNQPTKAAVEYLCHAKYLIRSDYAKGPSKFERTKKRRPAMQPDKGEARGSTSPRKQTSKYPFYQ